MEITIILESLAILALLLVLRIYLKDLELYRQQSDNLINMLKEQQEVNKNLNNDIKHLTKVNKTYSQGLEFFTNKNKTL